MEHEHEPLRYIMVGAGGFAATWCAKVLPRLAALGKARAVAAVDVDPAALPTAQECLGLTPEQCYVDGVAAFSENPADFAVIVVPPVHHEHYVDLALAHGLNVLSEKPIADTMEAAARIAAKVRRAGVKMAVTMSHRFDQDKQSLARAVRSGAYGDLHYVVVRFTMNSRAEGSWGAFRHHMPDPLVVEGTVHQFDVLREITASDVATISGVSWNPPWGEYEGDSAALFLLQMRNGVRCVYEGSKVNAATMNGWGHDYIRAECEHGTLELDGRSLRVLRSDGWLPPQAEQLPLDEQEAWMNPWLAEQFCDWLAGGPPPPTHLDDNLQCTAVTFAAIQASRTGDPVDVQEFLARHLAAAGADA